MFHRILAITRKTFFYYFLSPAYGIIIFLLLLLPFWCLRLEGDGTALGKFKIYSTYTFLLATIILVGTNIFTSCTVLTRDWRRKSIFLLDIKPVKRWEILAGKWLGIIFLNITLLAILFFSIFLSSKFLSRYYLPELRGEKNVFLTYQKILPSSQKSLPSSEVHSLLPGVGKERPAEEGKASYSVLPGAHVTWLFQGIAPTENTLILNYKFFTAKKEETKVIGFWIIGDPSSKNLFRYQSEVKAGETHKIRIPPWTLNDKGELWVTYFNIDPLERSVVFPKEEITLLTPWGNYWLNLIFGEFLLLLIISFVVFLGITLTTMTSTITGIIGTLVFTSISFARDILGAFVHFFVETGGKKTAGVSIYTHFTNGLLTFLKHLLPPLGECLSHNYVGNGIVPPLSLLGKLFVEVFLLKGLGVFLIGVLYFTRRELGIPNE